MKRKIGVGLSLMAASLCLVGVAMPVTAATTIASTAPAASVAAARTASASNMLAFDWAGVTYNGDSGAWQTATTPAQMQAVKNEGGTTLALDIDHLYEHSSDPTIEPAVVSYIDQAHQAGLQVEALWGNPEYAFPGTGQATSAAIANMIVTFNQNHPNEQFSGMQVDVEPWSLPDWNANPTQVAEDWLQMAQQDASIANSNGMSLTVDDLYNLDGSIRAPYQVTVGQFTGSPTQVLVDVLQDPSGPTNSIDDMAYRNFADGPSGSIAESANTFSDVNPSNPVNVIVGQETGGSPDNTTFAGCTYSDFHTQTGGITAHYASNPQFGGLAIDDLPTLLALS